MTLIENILGLVGVDPMAMNVGDFWGVFSVGFLFVVSLRTFLLKAPPSEQLEVTLKESEKPVTPEPVSAPEEVKPVEVPKVTWQERLKLGLSKTRKEVWGKLEMVISGSSGLGQETIEEIEEILYSADIGPSTVSELTEKLSEFVGKEKFETQDLKKFLYEFLKSKMKPIQQHVDISIYQYDKNLPKKTKVIMVVGVNGAGKTTTIGKLASKLQKQGAQVVVGACDTFRAAAVDQLEVWCKRAGAQIVRAQDGADPSGVAFEALQKAQQIGADYCIIDTAGRLHTNKNLMGELEKCKRVLAKLDSSAPHQVLLVLDAITGNNALKQAEEFHKALQVTGLVFTKCDGSSKAGNAVAIVQGLQVPITYIGVGESEEDLDIFNLEDYLKALLDLPQVI